MSAGLVFVGLVVAFALGLRVMAWLVTKAVEYAVGRGLGW